MTRIKQLFRQKALAAVSEGMDIEHAVRVTSRYAWLSMAGLMCAVIAIIFWLFGGAIPIRIHGQGILMPESGKLYQADAPEGTGRIKTLKVHPGEHIVKGQLIADLVSEESYQQLMAEKNLLDSLESELQTLIQRSGVELKKRAEDTTRQEKILNTILESETVNMQQIQDLLQTKQQSLAKGIATKQDVAITAREFYTSKREIEHTMNALVTIQNNLQDFRQQWNDRLRVLEIKIREMRGNVARLQKLYQLSQHVYSPVDGVVTDILVSTGQKVSGGDSVVLIADNTAKLDALLYIQAKDGKEVSPGMEVQVIPSIYNKQEFGGIRGKVISISTYPLTQASMLTTLQNEQLTEQFFQKGPILEVRVKLITDTHTQSGYAWTSSEGPAYTLSPGTMIDAMITVKSKKPIELLIPAIKKLVSES
ncbi:MAG: NHLP bacteriocin system secretion protein [Gammaproteobacteria bacterium]|nr:NHLP bacteriocin system secretion protein [Gammaproteobacteria bacterium]